MIIFVKSTNTVFSGLDQRVGVPQGFGVECAFHTDALEAYDSLFDCAALLAVPVSLLDQLHFPVEEDLSFLLLDQEARLCDSVSVALILHLVAAPFLVRGLGVRLTVKNHLGPRAVGLEDVEHISEEWVLRMLRARRHKRAVLDAVLSEELLLLLRDSKCRDHTFVFQLERGLCRAILYVAKHLQLKDGFLDQAAIPADLLVLHICAAHITLKLDLDELRFHDEPQHFNDVPDDLVRWNCLNQTYGVLGLEVSDGVLDVADHAERV